MINKRQIIIKILVWVGLRYPEKFIRELAKVEYGVAYYVRKLGDQVPSWKHKFYAHAIQEKYHGRMLAALIGEAPESEGGMAQKKWAYTPFVGNTQIEGVGKRYCVMRKILHGKSLDEYPFIDKLSIMGALESIAHSVYHEIAKQAKSPLKEVALNIAEDEFEHQSCLTELLVIFGDDFTKAIAWEKHIIDCIPYAIFDILRIINGNKSANSKR